MFCYTAYSLGIHSVLPLPELVGAESTSDVVISLGKVDGLLLEATVVGNFFRANAEDVYLYWEEVGAFLVRSGRQIIVDPVFGVEEQVLRLSLLGPVFAVLLLQREFLVLHASAVVVNGGAVAFLGGAGWGKSTLVASLYKCNYGVLTDDVMAVQVDESTAFVNPSFPQLKLWPEAANYLGDCPETLPRLYPQFEKRARCVTRNFPKVPMPLRRIYILAKGIRHEIEPLTPQEAFLELVGHSYAAHGFSRLLEARGDASLCFQQRVKLANCVPICRLQRQLSLSTLPDLVKLLEEDLAQTS